MINNKLNQLIKRLRRNKINKSCNLKIRIRSTQKIKTQREFKKVENKNKTAKSICNFLQKKIKIKHMFKPLLR